MGPKLRQTVYYLGTIVSGALGIALLFHGVSADAAGNINSMVAGLIALLGGSAPAAVAAHTITKQRADGAFNNSPVDQVTNGIQAVIQASTAAASDVERVKAVVSDALGQVPVLGPLAQQIINTVK